MRYLENERLLLEIAERGSELVRIYDKEKKREMLWNGDPAVWPKHSPLLFPMVGRSYNNKYRNDGKTYEMANHGFAWTSTFDFVNETKDSVTAVLKDTPESLLNYPFEFKLTVTHKLNGNTIDILWNVENTGKKDMYYNIGAHPAFVMQPEIKTSDVYLYFPGKTSLEYLFLNKESGCAMTENIYLMPLNGGVIRVTPTFWNNDVYIFEKQGIEEVGILDENKAPYVTVRTNGAPFVGVWTKPDAPFICLEPWHGRADNDGYEGELKDKYEVLTLKPGESSDFSYSITIE